MTVVCGMMDSMSNDVWHPSRPNNDDAPAFAIPYATSFDPPPGEDGYFLNIGRDRGYNIFPTGLEDETMEAWRRVTISHIRMWMERLGAPRGTNFHQLIRMEQKLPVTEDPAPPRDPDEEDSRLIAEYEWELRQNFLAFPAGIQQLFRSHTGNILELNRR